jgi:hypothetical protein
MTGVASNAARWYGEGVILVYDLCHDQLTTGQQSGLVSSINTWASYWETQAWGAATDYDNNYNWGYMRNELEWCIASYGENSSAAGFCDDAITTRWGDFTVSAASGNDQGGVFGEGSEYGHYQMWYSIVPFVTANLEGRDVYNESQYFKQGVFYNIYATTPAPTLFRGSSNFYYAIFPFGDDQFFKVANQEGADYYTGDFMTTVANYWSGIGVGKLARQWLNTVTPIVDQWVAAEDPGGTAQAFTTLPLDYYAIGTQYLYGRNQWGSTATTFQIQMGQSTSTAHGHWDYGNWQIWRNGYWLSRESTGYDDTYTGYNGVGTAPSADAIAHNVALINPDSAGCAIGTTCWGNGSIDSLGFNAVGLPTVNRLESQSAYTYADVDMTAASRLVVNKRASYPFRDNPAAGHVEREFIFMRSLETLVILDRLQSISPDGGTTPAASIKKTFVAHCETNPTLVDATHETCTNGTQALYITNLEPVTTTHEVVNEYTAASNAQGQYRIEINDPGTTAQSYLLNVMQAGTSGGANVTASVVDSNSSDVTSGTFTVTLHPANGSDTTIVFNKGLTSGGGTINIAAGGVINLASTVENISYTDNGPVWAGNSTPTGGFSIMTGFSITGW